MKNKEANICNVVLSFGKVTVLKHIFRKALLMKALGYLSDYTFM